MFKVKIGNDSFSASMGERLSDVLMKNGLGLPHPCGGNGQCGKCKVTVNGKEELSCRYEIKGDIAVRFPEESVENRSFICGYNRAEDSAFVLDLGTTTLCLGELNLSTGRLTNVITATNPQKLYGADVISRIAYCTENGVALLQGLVAEAVDSMLGSFSNTEGKTLYVGGNTTMLHIFAGINPRCMGTSPYTPEFTEEQTLDSADLGIKNLRKTVLLPSISAFVGADLVAGLNCVDMPQKGKYSILADLGTNAEIILFSKEQILCTSAAAGPCFEGVNISKGMSAVNGAIFSYDSPAAYKTVNNQKATGICGTGLVDIIAYLLKNFVIDSTGYMENEEFEVCDGVFLTQKDVRNYQLAKSAVLSGIETLLNIVGIEAENLEKLYISGGFSEKINPENAVCSGLLPPIDREKIIPLGNSCLTGTAKYAFEKTDLEQILKKARYIDLSTNSVFNEKFVKNMNF